MSFFIALFFLGGYIFLAVVVTRFLSSHANTERIKLAIQGLCVAIFILFPMGDAIVAKMYHAALCRNNAGIQFVRSVQRDHPIYQHKAPGILFLPNGSIDEERVKQFMELKYDRENLFLRVSRKSFLIRDLRTDEVYAILVDFVNAGGWVANSTGLPVSPDRCFTTEGLHTQMQSVYRSVFGGDKE